MEKFVDYIGFACTFEQRKKAETIAKHRAQSLSEYLRGLIDRDKTDELIDKAVKKGEKTK